MKLRERLIGNIEAELFRRFGGPMQKLKPYSKAIAALVSAFAAIVAVHVTGVDSAALEALILALLTAAGVYAAPANAVKPGTMRLPWPLVLVVLVMMGFFG